MTNRIDEMKHPYRYFYKDGLAEIAVGGLFLVIGVLLQAVAVVRTGSPLAVVVVIGLPVLTIAGAFLLKKVVQDIKESVTYPRNGGWSWRRCWDWRVALLFLPKRVSRMGLAEGAMLCVVLCYMGYRVWLSRLFRL